MGNPNNPQIPEPAPLTAWVAMLNNLASETALPAGALREATNILPDGSGKPQLRDGYSLAIAGVAVHSAWSKPPLPFGLYVDGGTLYAVMPDNRRTALVAGLAAGLPVAYEQINDTIFWSNGAQRGLITLDLEALPWCCESPSGQPTVNTQADGALDPGVYQTAVTFVDARGRESGTGRATYTELPGGGALVLSNLPQPADTSARIRLYATNGNDGVLRAAVTLARGVLGYTLGQRAEGRDLNTQFLVPMPAGHMLAAGHGRQYVARGNEVLYSPALRYGLFDPRAGRVGFGGRIELLSFVGDGTDAAGLYVADGARTYFLIGADPKAWKQQIAVGCSAVPGTCMTLEASLFGIPSDAQVPVWLARDGFFRVGLPAGQILVLKQGECVIDTADRGASLFRNIDGNRLFVSALRGARPNGLAIRDEMIVHEYRHDT